MPNKVFGTAAAVLVCALTFVISSSAGEPPSTPIYRSFPQSGFDYPVNSNDLSQWVKKGQWRRVREHGWNLFVGLHGPQPMSPQVWEAWFSLPTTFVADTILGAVAKPMPKRTLHNKHLAATGSHGIQGAPSYESSCDFAGKEFLNNDDIMIAGVYYNQEAYQYVRGDNRYQTKYYQTEALQALRTSGKKSIEPFPAASISIKHMYWPVRQDGLTALPVSPHYNPAPDPANPDHQVIPKDPLVYNGYETWNDGVAIAPTEAIRKTAGKTASVELYLPDPNYVVSFARAPVVSLDRFYYRKIGTDEWDNMNSTDKCILNQSARWAYNRDFKANDYIVSVAMHIVTKEFAPWTMQSFWWSPKPNFGRYAQDRLKHFPDGAWKNYMMCTAYDMENPVEGDGTPHVCSNPYIELVIPETYRSVTNCQNCHARGAYPAAEVLTNVITQDAHYNSERRGAIYADDPIFDGLITTDFSWSIPLSTTPHPKQ